MNRVLTISHEVHKDLSAVQNPFLARSTCIPRPERAMGILKIKIGNRFPNRMDLIWWKRDLILSAAERGYGNVHAAAAYKVGVGPHECEGCGVRWSIYVVYATWYHRDGVGHQQLLRTLPKQH